VHLTEKALQIKEDVRKVLTDWRERLTFGLTEEEKQMAHSILEKMGNNAARFAEEQVDL
jgi:DNA-binding MarR family transcriptional regulator